MCWDNARATQGKTRRRRSRARPRRRWENNALTRLKTNLNNVSKYGSFFIREQAEYIRSLKMSGLFICRHSVTCKKTLSLGNFSFYTNFPVRPINTFCVNRTLPPFFIRIQEKTV